MAIKRDFHENDPTIPLWLSLLSNDKGPSGPMSEEQKKILSKKKKEYLLDKPNTFADIPEIFIRNVSRNKGEH